MLYFPGLLCSESLRMMYFPVFFALWSLRLGFLCSGTLKMLGFSKCCILHGSEPRKTDKCNSLKNYAKYSPIINWSKLPVLGVSAFLGSGFRL